MTSHIRRVALSGVVFAATLVWGSTPGQAISCIGGGEVTSLALGGCDLGPLHFDSFAVTATGQNNFNAAVFLGGAPFTNVTTEQTSGGQATLGFQVAHSPAPTTGFADILLSYRASTLSGNVLLGGVNLSNGGTGVTINERVCQTAFAGNVCTTGLLANIIVPGNGSAEVRFTPDLDVHQIFIFKDISFEPGSFISDFSNSHELGAIDTVPEPATLLLLGSTFAGLGAAYKRRKRVLPAPLRVG